MKKFLIVATFLFFFSPYLKAADMLDVDYGFIDTAFDGIQPITNQQFEQISRR